MFLVGVNMKYGYTIVENWEFSHQPTIWNGDADDGDSAWTLPLSKLSRRIIHDAKEITHICDIFGDFQNRFILLLGWKNEVIHQMDPQTGSVRMLFSPKDSPDIENHKQITMMIHKTEGYIFYLVPWITGQEVRSTDWHLDIDGRRFTVCDSVLFRDADKNGEIDPGSLQSITQQEWYDGGYLDQSNLIADNL